jgi:hypothetical protein
MKVRNKLKVKGEKLPGAGGWRPQSTDAACHFGFDDQKERSTTRTGSTCIGGFTNG